MRQQRKKRLLLENERVGVVELQHADQQIPGENLAAQLRVRASAGRTSCLDSRSAVRRMRATLGVSLAQIASKMEDMAPSKRTAFEMSSFGF